MTEYIPYSPQRAASLAYQTKTPPKYVDHRDAIYNTTLSPYQTPNQDSTSLKYQDAALSESLSASKVKLEDQVKDIKTILDAKYNGETELWRQKWQESENKRNALEVENQRLVQEIASWKARSNDVDVERYSTLLASDSKRAAELTDATSQVEQRSLSLRLEADRLWNLLQDKIEECNEIKANYSKMELLNAENQTQDQIAEGYEAKIQILKNNYTDKLKEVEELKQKRVRLEMDNIELKKVQKEAEELKALLEAKRDENAQIRRQKTELEVENFKSKKAESTLLEKEALLKSQVESLENEAQQVSDLRKSNYLEKSKNLGETQENLRKSLHVEKTAIQSEIEEKQKEAAQKLLEAENLRKDLAESKQELAKEEIESSLAENELAAWREKASAADKLKEEEIQRAALLKEETIKLTQLQNEREKNLLEERANSLKEVVSSKVENLSKVIEEQVLTESEKRQLEEEKALFQVQVNELLKKLEENEKKFSILVSSTDNLHSYELERLNKEHESEKRRINNQIDALRNVIGYKREEADQARREANELCLRQIAAENKARASEVDSEYWKTRSARIAREKEIESQVQRELTKSQLQNLERQQSIERLAKEKEAEIISSLIDYKEQQKSELRNSQVRTASVLARERQDKLRLEAEAQLNRSRALEAERAKLDVLRLKESIHNEVVDSLRRSRVAENALLRSEVSLLSESLVRKEREARDWKDNYSKLASSPIKQQYE